MDNNKPKKKRKKKYIKKTSYFRSFFCIFFSCITFLVISFIVIIKHCSIDYYSIKDLLKHVFPSIMIVGALGWLAGLILDNPKKSLIIDYKDLIYEELIRKNAKITPEELEEKLRIVANTNEEDDEAIENFSFEDADFNLGESDIEDSKIEL